MARCGGCDREAGNDDDDETGALVTGVGANAVAAIVALESDAIVVIIIG